MNNANKALDLACRRLAAEAYKAISCVDCGIHCVDCGLRLSDTDVLHERRRCTSCHASLNNVETVEFDPCEILRPAGLHVGGIVAGHVAVETGNRPSSGESIVGAGDEDEEPMAPAKGIGNAVVFMALMAAAVGAAAAILIT